jgi:multiple sugar transport system ATP-binding protein
MRRGKISALRDINLEIPAGGFFVLLGPSGCGKTTLLNLIAGLERPTEGEIRIDDQLAASSSQKIFLSPRERDVAMVFQSYALYPHMNVAENIAFPLKMAKVNRDEIARRVRDVAETLELLSLLDARPAELSGGQRQRVALGRAIVRHPRVLLLDEPLSNLDALLRIGMRAELKQIQRRLGVTTIYVTHDQVEAMSMGDRIAVMKDGLIQQIGTSAEIYEEPANIFMAKFIGNPPANILSPGQYRDIRAHFRENSFIMADNVIAALRPEHIRIDSADKGILKGTIGITAALGSETFVYIMTGDRQLIVRTSAKPPWHDGDSVGLSFDFGNLLFFDTDSGRRIVMKP